MRSELQEIATRVEQTSRLAFCFQKGNLITQINEQLSQVEQHLNVLEAKKLTLESDFAKQLENLTALEERKAEILAQLTSQSDKLKYLEEAKSTIEQKFVEQENALERNKRQLKKKSQEIEELEDELDDEKAKLNEKQKELDEHKELYKHLSEQHQQLINFHQKLETDSIQERTSAELRECLIGHLISAQNENKHLSHFRSILFDEFLPFAAEESSLQNEAGALLKLQEIEKELMMISGFPEFHSARAVAVGGGFSAGKSEFISSLFSDKTLKLPSSIEPTTAIPTYVVNSKQANRLIGMNTQGGVVDLLKIDPDLLKKLSHQFMQTFHFPLKNVMPYMFLTTKLAYEHLCFVDTPGYNPTGSHTAQDMVVASQFIEASEALLWLVGADSNGTIPRSDIDFLKDVLKGREKPVYFVLNKADLKSRADINAILVEFTSKLKEAKINYVGISAYNSIEGTEINFRKMKLLDFLKSMNKASGKQDEILRKLYEVEFEYQYAIKRDIKQRRAIAKALDDIAFDLNQANFKRGNDPVYDQLDMVASYFNSKVQESHLKQLTGLMTNFTKVINSLFGRISQEKRPNVNPALIEIEEFAMENNAEKGIEQDSYGDEKQIIKTKRELKIDKEKLHTNTYANLTSAISLLFGR